MDSAIADEILEELSSTLQRIEAQSAAVLEFVKAKGIAKGDELAPYLERAGAASSVRWRATRVRLAHLLEGLEKSEQRAKGQEKEREQQQAKEQKGKERQGEEEQAASKQQERETEQAGGQEKVKSAEAAEKRDGAEGRTEEAEARSDGAKARSDGAKARTDEAKARGDKAKSRADEAKAHAEEAKARTDDAKTRTDEAIAHANGAKARVAEAETHTEDQKQSPKREGPERSEDAREQAKTFQSVQYSKTDGRGAAENHDQEHAKKASESAGSATEKPPRRAASDLRTRSRRE